MYIFDKIKNDGTFEVLYLAPEDPCRTCAGLMFGRIRKYAAAGHFEEKGMIAWY